MMVADSRQSKKQPANIQTQKSPAPPCSFAARPRSSSSVLATMRGGTFGVGVEGTLVVVGTRSDTTNVVVERFAAGVMEPKAGGGPEVAGRSATSPLDKDLAPDLAVWLRSQGQCQVVLLYW